MKPIFDVTVSDGKYRVILDSQRGLYALRHGEEWRNLTGDNLILSLASELEDARKEIQRLRNTQAHLDDIRKTLKQE